MFEFKTSKKSEGPQDVPFEETGHVVDLNYLLSQLASVNEELANNIREIEASSLAVMVERNKGQGYKDSYAVMGIQGAIFQVLHKAARLLNTVCDNPEDGFKLTGKQMVEMSIDEQGKWKDNSIYGHLLDLLNYTRLTLNLLIKLRNKGMLKAPDDKIK
jgi:hypothetical protein